MLCQVIQALRYLTNMDICSEPCLGATVLTGQCSPAMCANALAVDCPFDYRNCIIIIAISPMDRVRPLEASEPLSMNEATMSRLEDLKRFYEILARLERGIGGSCELANCDGRIGWPQWGVYFFCEPGENRSDSGDGLRIVRVGTGTSKRGLWPRLREHKGRADGGGNHRSSVFRQDVGKAIIRRYSLEREYPEWGRGQSAPKSVRDGEEPLERKVSRHIGEMPFLWLALLDGSLRKYIECNAIALLSNYRKPPMDESSAAWLGRCDDSTKISESGLWNSQHVEKHCEATFLDCFGRAVEEMQEGVG